MTGSLCMHTWFKEARFKTVRNSSWIDLKIVSQTRREHRFSNKFHWIWTLDAKVITLQIEILRTLLVVPLVSEGLTLEGCTPHSHENALIIGLVGALFFLQWTIKSFIRQCWSSLLYCGLVKTYKTKACLFQTI